jgi:hypothetical protein
MIKLSVKADTTEKTFICSCHNGHIFNSKLPVVINTSQNFEFLNLFDDDGSWQLFCPVCQMRWSVSHPIIVNIESKQEVKLFIPSALLHLVTDIKAEMAAGIAENQEDLPLYFTDYKVVFNKDALVDTKVEVSHNEALNAKDKIHDAFADLASIIPDPPKED